MRPSLPAVLCLTLALAPPSATARDLARPDADSELELGRSRAGYLVVELEAEGAPLRFALDTGASQTMIAAEHARSLGRPRERLDVLDARGESVEGLAAGPVVWRLGVRDLVLPSVGWIPGRRELLPESAELDGVLGSDLLHGLDVWIDPLAGRLRVDAPGALGGRYAGTTVRLETIAGRPALAIELLDLDRRPVTVRLVVDSGADSVLLFGRLAERLAAARGAGLARATGLATAHGAGAVSGVPIGRARCGDAKLRLGAALLLPEVRGRIEDGLVPLDRLGPVLFQLAGERAVLGARPGAAPAAPTADRLAATDRRNR